MTASATDKLQSQYKDAGNLTARISLHQKYSTNPYGWHIWAFDQLVREIPAKARILEIGCGRADLWVENKDRIPAGWQIQLSDQSEGMLAAAKNRLGVLTEKFAFLRLDVQDMGGVDGDYDVIIANHMLYHVADRPRGIRNIYDHLKPGGKLFAATNGKDHLATFRSPEIMAILYPDGPPDKLIFYAEGSGDWFHLEDGALQLGECFDEILVFTYDDGLLVEDTQALIDFHRSYVSVSSDQEGDLRKVYESMRKDGRVAIPKAVGMFMATKD